MLPVTPQTSKNTDADQYNSIAKANAALSVVTGNEPSAYINMVYMISLMIGVRMLNPKPIISAVNTHDVSPTVSKAFSITD